MTRDEAVSLAPRRWDWLPWKRVGISRLVTLTLIGVVVGIALAKVHDAVIAPAAVHRNSTAAVIFDGYVGVQIDRTRTSYCSPEPSRILFQPADITVGRMPVILPVTSQALVWSELGRQKFVLLLAKLSDVPAGTWQVRETQQDRCGPFAWLTGGRTVINVSQPISVP